MKVPKRSSNIHNLDMIRKYEPFKYLRLGRAIEEFVCMGQRGRYDHRVKIAARTHNITSALLKHALEKYYGYFEKPVTVSFFREVSGDMAVFVEPAGRFE